ncbi:glycosyltransferase family 4 protein [Roseomonas sp. OT10]|uniref:glycosyltransferase family 4 protein n=1 Tax=Roseomonas cutis TaxID=2897332 RepID=UPI001E3029AE|nr:glycosyltransferase family 1 protein [Roseomonas sp. OT10]UFN50421.1 glycosyltransferase family 4 protein [Roseomonas sp. OT10]
MTPRICIDGYNLGLEQGTGVATYARNLSFRLGAMGASVDVLYGTRASPSKDPLIREIAFFDGRVGKARPLGRILRTVRRLLLPAIGHKAQRVPITGTVLTRSFEARLPHFDALWNVEELFSLAANHFNLHKTRLKVRLPERPGLMHWTYPVPVVARGLRNIYTLHDLVPLRLPYTTLDHKRRYLRLNRLLVREADHIVTVSEASRRDIINLLGCPPEKVTNTYQSVELPPSLARKPEDEARDEVMGSLGLGWKEYFLFFGAIEPKKNVGRLIEAHLASGVARPLVIVGKQAWKSEEELRMLYEDHQRWVLPGGQGTATAARRRLRERIILVDYLPFRLLVSVIRGARSVLFPSLYEGFGLPALEAMSLGTPVLTSDTASLPEVVGDAALTVDPYDVRALVEGIRALDTDADLRGRLSEAGPRQAALFSAAAYERRIAALYGRLGVPLGG